MAVIIKIKLLLYAGTCEIVGGDTKYFCGLANGIEDSKAFDLVIAADENDSFRSRVEQWMTKEMKITYLPTKPIIGKRLALESVDKLITRKLLGRPLSKYLNLIISLLLFSTFREFFHNFFVFDRLFKKHKNIQVFHCNAGSFPGRTAGIAGILAARANKCPKIIMTIHNESQATIDPMAPIYDQIVRYCCDHLIPVSVNVENSLLNKKKFKPSKLNRISIGLEDKPIFFSKDLIPPDNTFKILIIGNFEEKRKGHEPLFYALAELIKTHPHVKLLIAGTGSFGRKIELDELAKVLEIDKHIEWLGYLENIDEVLLRSSVVAVPSIGPEAIPYTIVEALRAGKPVITSNKGGCSEAVIDNFNGFIVDPNNINDVSSNLAVLVEDKIKLKAFGENSRQFFLDKFDQKIKMKDHFELYCGNTSKTSR